jgi:hypothetical protein
MRLVRPQAITDTSGLVSTTVVEAETAWSNVATYAAGAIHFKSIAGIHQRFKSAAAGNIGHDPETDNGTWWTPLGPTNAWGMFDGLVQTQTTDADDITVVLEPSGRINTLALLNISGRSVRVLVEHPDEGVILDQTVNLTSTSGIGTLPSYLLEPIVRKTDLILPDLRWRLGSTLTVTVSAPGETVGVGALIIGQARSLGDTRWGATLGYDDYSVKQRDAFGNFIVVERGYSKRGSFEVIVPPGMIDELQRLLIQYRATPVLFIGDERYGAMAIYGFVKSLDEVVQYETHILANMEFESVT